MRIVLANPHGFCAGVVMAIRTLDRALELFGPPLYVYHEIVHNNHVVASFRHRGVVFVDSVEEVPQGGRLIYSAHGVGPQTRLEAKDRNLQTIDATCPLVSKVHLEAVRFAGEGRTVILIGHAGHDEAIGTLGEAPEQMKLIESVEDVDALVVPDPTKMAYITQTTLSVDEANHIIARLKTRFPQIVGPPKKDICYATQNRQDAVKMFLPTADVVLVLGSRNSSNSNRLAEIAREGGRPAYLIDRAHEIDPTWLEGCETVLVTAGASAPEEVVEECVAYLVDRYGATIEQGTVREEHAHFALPVELRDAEEAVRSMPQSLV
jgi:4-hydroxy-3-methylbut-2-en-1-yl diphosphate reductase